MTSTCVAWPATPSSVELSTISLKRWLMPRLSVEPMYMPGRLRTASSPSRCVRSSAPYRVSAVTGIAPWLCADCQQGIRTDRQFFAGRPSRAWEPPWVVRHEARRHGLLTRWSRGPVLEYPHLRAVMTG